VVFRAKVLAQLRPARISTKPFFEFADGDAPLPPTGNTLICGNALFTKAGEELWKIAEARKNEAYFESAVKAWKNEGLTAMDALEFITKFQTRASQ
jgi:hypothetical protein